MSKSVCLYVPSAMLPAFQSCMQGFAIPDFALVLGFCQMEISLGTVDTGSNETYNGGKIRPISREEALRMVSSNFLAVRDHDEKEAMQFLQANIRRKWPPCEHYIFGDYPLGSYGTKIGFKTIKITTHPCDLWIDCLYSEHREMTMDALYRCKNLFSLSVISSRDLSVLNIQEPYVDPKLVLSRLFQVGAIVLLDRNMAEYYANQRGLSLRTMGNMYGPSSTQNMVCRLQQHCREKEFLLGGPEFRPLTQNLIWVCYVDSEVIQGSSVEECAFFALLKVQQRPRNEMLPEFAIAHANSCGDLARMCIHLNYDAPEFIDSSDNLAPFGCTAKVDNLEVTVNRLFLKKMAARKTAAKLAYEMLIDCYNEAKSSNKLLGDSFEREEIAAIRKIRPGFLASQAPREICNAVREHTRRQPVRESYFEEKKPSKNTKRY